MKRALLTLLSLSLFFQITGCTIQYSGTRQEMLQEQEVEARAALERLYLHTPGARSLANGAHGILVFPDLTKAGFVVGGQFGRGVLFRYGRVAGYYKSTALSYGLQAGVQKFGYALFFMTKSDLDYLGTSGGWEVGIGPSVTVVDEGFAKTISTTASRQGVYAFFFEQRGLMAGLGIQGTKITKTDS